MEASAVFLYSLDFYIQNGNDLLSLSSCSLQSSLRQFQTAHCEVGGYRMGGKEPYELIIETNP